MKIGWIKKLRNKKKSEIPLIRRILLALNYFSVLLILISYSAQYINPVKFPLIAFFGLAYPVFLILQFIFIIIWLIQGRWQFLISLAAIIVGLNYLQAHIQLRFGTSSVTDIPQLKVQSYNVRLFGFYDWKTSKPTRDKMIRFLAKNDPDIICFQEFFDNDNGEFPVIDSLKAHLRTQFYQTNYFFNLNKNSHFGLATFSVYKILNGGTLQANNNGSNYAIYSDILWEGDTIRVYNIHLESIRFSAEDYTFYNDVTTDPMDKKEIKSGSYKIIRKLYRAFGKRSVQANLIAEHVKRCPYPLIICGDFNDTPTSYAYHKISSGLHDAFLESGTGLGNTYVGVFPSFRIDYILYSKDFSSSEFKTDHVKYSDHYPVNALLYRIKH